MSTLFAVGCLTISAVLLALAVKAWLDASLECE